MSLTQAHDNFLARSPLADSSGPVRPSPKVSAIITLTLGLLAPLLSIPSSAHAEQYVATGDAWGSECTNYVLFESCTTYLIAGTQDSQGNIVPLPRTYDSVDQYNETDRKCWLRFRYTSGWLGYLLTRAVGPRIVTKTSDGTHRIISTESIVFPCFKQ